MKNSTSKLRRSGRRNFLKNSGGAVLLIGASGILPQFISCTAEETLNEILEKHALTTWVRLSKDGLVTIYNPAAEMGQGSMTSLPVIFAEEMDADWDLVRVEFSPQESETYGSDGWGPNRRIMLSAGSRVTSGYYNLLRKAGAQARFILMHSAANYWNIPVEQLTTKAGKVQSKNGGKEILYGDLVPYLSIPEILPDYGPSDLKNPSDYRLIGKVTPRTDIPSKTNGSAMFAMDINLPGMLYGVIERGEVHGSKPTLKNEPEIVSMPGVQKVIPLDHGIGVIASRIEEALAAKKSMKIEWGTTEATGFNSDKAYEVYEKKAGERNPGKPVVEKGDFRKAKRNSVKTYSVDFKNDYVYHAQMEPLNAIVKVTKDSQSAEVWVGSQQGFDSKLGVPQALNIDPSKVNIHLQYLGGGFGRRSMTDFVTECAFLAAAVPGLPVKLIWTREDDLRYGAYRPMSLQRLEATTDQSGMITGLSHIVIGDGDNLVASGIRNDHYNIPVQYAEIRTMTHGVRLKHWRAVGHGPNKFAIESMIDEIANDQGIDPVEMRRSLMSTSPRALATLEKAATMARWDEPSGSDRAKGVAFVERSGTLSTGICEISLDRSTGKIKVHHFWSASDAGVVVQPDNARAQIEGGIIMGMSSVFKERISIIDGAVQQSNFHDYELLRMEDIPESIETEFIYSEESPQGVGESGTPLVAGAVANAFYSLTGKTLRHLPFTPEKVLKALGS